MTADRRRGGERRATTVLDQSALRTLPAASQDTRANPRQPTSPLVHIPLYCAPNASDFVALYMVELHLACLDSYFAHGNTYDVLVTTNDTRPLEVFAAYKANTKRHFELRLVNRADLRSTFRTDESRLMDVTCTRTVFSKFFPILNRECDPIVHVDCDTIFLSKVDLSPLLVSGVGLVDANQFMRHQAPWCPTAVQAEFFGIGQPVVPVSRWINSGVFSVQGGGFEIVRTEIGHYLENLERAIADGHHVDSDEIIMNALAVRRRDIVTVIPDYHYNFLAYYLRHDPWWTCSGRIIHFHSLKPDAYWYINGAVEYRWGEAQLERLSDDFYLAVLMWFRHAHAACRQLAYEFPICATMPLEVVEKEFERATAERDRKMNAGLG
jgi:hypothetical protein